VIFFGGSRDIAKNESSLGLLNFVKGLENTNVIIVTAPHRFDLQSSSCVNREVDIFNRKLSKQLRSYDYIQLCSMPKNRENFTTQGLHMNLKGKTWLINNWTSLILAMVTRTQNKVAIPLPWMDGEEGNVVDSVNKNILSAKISKLSTKVEARNHRELKAKVVMRQNSNQVNEDSEKTDLEQQNFNKDSVVKKALNEAPCSSSSETSDQNISDARLFDIDVEVQIKVMDKEPLSYDKGDLLEVQCEKMDKVKPKYRIPSDSAIRRSTRPKNLKAAKLDNFLWKN
jgi:hypothetical protein